MPSVVTKTNREFSDILSCLGHWRNLAQLNLVHLLPSVLLHQQQQSLDLPLDKLARETYLSINSRATLIDSVAYRGHIRGHFWIRIDSVYSGN